MQKSMFFYFLLIILVVSLGFIFTMRVKTPENQAPTMNFIETQIKGKTYSLEVAATSQSQQIGLMNRTNLDENSGMLFVFGMSSIYPFWMKDTLIPLDMIWVNKDKEVVFIKENAQPCSTTIGALCKSIIPLKPALYVIELNGGDVQKLGLKTGDKIDFKL